MQFLAVSNYLTVTAIYKSRSSGPVRLHRHRRCCLRPDYATPYTMVNECLILNEAKASDGEGTCLKSLRKITKYFVLDGRQIWVTE